MLLTRCSHRGHRERLDRCQLVRDDLRSDEEGGHNVGGRCGLLLIIAWSHVQRSAIYRAAKSWLPCRRVVRVQLWLVQMLGNFWVGDIVSIYKVGVIHLIKLISDDMSAWEYRAGHEARDLFSLVLDT